MDTMETTQRIGVSVKRNVWQEFNDIILNKYGQSRYFLSLETNEALEIYIKLMKGELLLKVADTGSDFGVYAHTQEKSMDTMVVRQFKEKIQGKFKTVSYKDLRKFAIDDCGFTSRTKYYDVRDELLAKKFIEYYGDSKQIFAVKEGGK